MEDFEASLQKLLVAQMSRYIGRYVSTCDMCMHTKASWQSPVRELHLLPIPDALWDTISVDFIVKLLWLMNNKEVRSPVLMFGTEQIQLLEFDSQVIRVSSSSQCSVQGLLECLLLGIV